MKYYLDCEFNGLGGELISLALVREDGSSFYAVFECVNPTAWIAENVLTVIENCPVSVTSLDRLRCAQKIASFLRDDEDPIIISDWPDDIKYFCELIIEGSLYWDLKGGPMFNLPSMTFKAMRVDAYPTTLVGAVRHNAWWDAMALRHKLHERP